MSIATQISRLQTLRNNIRTKLISLGLISNSSATLNDCYTAINGVAKRTSSDMTVSGATVTAPAGYYASAQSKSVASGSAKTPATTITKNPTISVSSAGKITATVSGTQSVTPTVSAGYVSSGTAGTITVSGSAEQQMTTKAATTYNTSTSDQTIAAGTYLTGAQTIRGVQVSGLSSEYILSGHLVMVGDSAITSRIASVTGTYLPYMEFTDLTVSASAWVSDSTYSDYPYAATVTCSGVTSTMFPYVAFTASDVELGVLCGKAMISSNDKVIIYSKEAVALTIPKITVYKRYQ